ncbi:MAG: hypothetical protein F6K31_15030 [Symploca sp. SIO2G7]|nr:hypothetical protein [Symploca sp. SIO2G7]
MNNLTLPANGVYSWPVFIPFPWGGGRWVNLAQSPLIEMNSHADRVTVHLTGNLEPIHFFGEDANTILLELEAMENKIKSKHQRKWWQKLLPW